MRRRRGNQDKGRKGKRKKACPTGKAWYRDRVAAELYGSKIGLRVYVCELCRRWHLTSKPDRKKA